MDNIQANIVVAVESANAEKQIGRVRDRLTEVTDQRIKDLKIAESKAKLEVAEYKSMEAAQAAYNAKLKEEEKIKQIINAKKKGYFVDEIKQLTRERMNLHSEYLKASENEASANYNALKAKIAYDNLSSTFNKTGKNISFASKKMKDFTYQTAAARTASRLLGFDLGGGSNLQILNGSIIAAGAFSVLKIAKFSIEKYFEKFKDLSDYAKMNSDEIGRFTSKMQQQIDKQNDTIASIEKLQEKEKLSNVEKLEMIRLIDNLGNKYKYLSEEIDITSGKLNNFEKIRTKITRDQDEKKLKQIEREMKSLRAARDANEKYIKSFTYEYKDTVIHFNSWNPFNWKIEKDATVTRTPIWNEGEVKRLEGENEKISNKLIDLNKERVELSKKLKNNVTEKEIEENIKARSKDREEAYRNELKQLSFRASVQDKLNKGLYREAKLLEIRNSLSKRYDLTQEQKNEIERMQIALFDMSNKKKTPDSDSNKSFKTIRGLGLLRTTAENVVGANTLEGIRLQSRILNKGSEEVDKRILGNAQKQTVILEKIQKNTEGVKIAPQKENFTPFYLLSKEYQKKKIKEANMNINKFINPLSGGPVEKFLPKPEKFNGWQKILEMMNPNPKGEKMILKFDENDKLIGGIKRNEMSTIPKDLKNMVAFLKEMRDDIHNIRRNGNTMNIRAV